MPTVQVRLKAAFAEANRIFNLLQDVFDEDGAPVSMEETPAYSGIWTVDVILHDADPDESASLVRDVLGSDGFALDVEAVVLDDATNWIALSEEIRKPVEAGRFFLHGAHDRGRRPINTINIEIDAELAFGTGHHATTWACLMALDRLFKRDSYQRPLDLGTGTGVLAIAAARVLRVPVLATDIDPVAVKVAQANAQLNGVGSLVRCVTADGMNHPLLKSEAPFDLVLANILARPLTRLAAPVARGLTPDATVVLSGLRTSDAPMVLSAWAMQGYRLNDSVTRDDWMALILKR